MTDFNACNLHIRDAVCRNITNGTYFSEGIDEDGNYFGWDFNFRFCDVVASCRAIYWSLTIVHDSDIEVTGVGSAEVSYDPGQAFNVSIGFMTRDNIRLEGEYGYKKADLDKLSGPGGSISLSGADVTIKSYMFNGYYDIDTQSVAKPFIGVGFGLLNAEFEDYDTVFGYQFTVGTAFKVSDKVNFDLSYRFQGAPTDFEEDGVSVSYQSSNILAGIRYNF